MATGDRFSRVEDLLQSIADGEAIDWPALERQAAGDEALLSLLAESKIVAGVAKIHRSPDLDEELTASGPAGGTTNLPGYAGVLGADGLPSFDERGHRWGHLLLLRRIGEGAFGEVFEARDTWLDHVVAVKLLKPTLANQAQLLQEARLLARIRHENVVRVHGADVNDRRIGFWMEFVQGQTLADVIAQDGVRSAHEAVMFGRDLCRALSAVHAKGIAHRDIKAKNVMRETGGRIVLMDFGAGEAMDSETSGQRSGTPLYLAPELFDDRPATVQSDIYALGVLLFHLVTNRYPVVGASIDDLKLAHQRGDRLLLGDLRPDLPDAFVRVVERMLAPDPVRRYATAATAREALEGVVVPAPPVPVAVPSPRPRWVFPLAVAGVALLSITLFGLLATASFNLTFGRRNAFGSEPILQSFVWGLRALLSPIVRIGLALVFLTILVAAARLAARLIAPLGAGWTRWRSTAQAFARDRGLDDPTLALQVVTGIGAVGFIALGVLLREQTTAFAIFIDTATQRELAALQPGNAAKFSLCGRLLEIGLFLYGIATYAVYTGAGRAGRVFRRGAVTVAIVVPVLALVLLRALPYRTVYQSEFERVDLMDQRCYAIGTAAREFLLHCPDAQPPRNLVVDQSDTRLRQRGVVESVFTPPGEAWTASQPVTRP